MVLSLEDTGVSISFLEVDCGNVLNADCSSKKSADGASHFVNLACLTSSQEETKCKRCRHWGKTLEP